ncbi:hypothetical protein RGQ29_017207 [Quercus rubra]|uniref:Uncharacterized protein n=1 Tax=Quercus rubra TaxID=3512 RepID=A0AAN7ISY3_QUERU|nr:hypothetical protein RGQ29_017207 [Quercus rubra]
MKNSAVFSPNFSLLVELRETFCLATKKNEQEFRSYTAWLAAFAFLLGFLLTLLGLKYQNPGVSVFDTHRAIILLLILNVCTCTISLAMIIVLPTSNKTHLSFFKNVFLFSGVFACDLVLLVLIPPLGWFIFIISTSVLFGEHIPKHLLDADCQHEGETCVWFDK